ncbi:ATP-grasp domain-containing protein [Streptomyces sp. NPDC049970]|uniref:ATP-grasp domain-containing protein n=1 Tax=Streptomyces sp. NPDC049970 TaxID=3155033 RepID=UPI00341C8CE8
MSAFMESPGISHVVLGFSVGLLNQLERVLPPGSVLVVEEPAMCAARDVAAQLKRFRCAVGMVEAPVQDEANAARLAGHVDRPAAVRAVLPGLEYTVVAAAELAEAWGLPNGSPRAVRAFRDKSLLRERVERQGIAQPDWVRVDGPQDVARFRDAHGGECVLKPTHLQGSVGIQLLGSGDDTAEAWRRTASADEAHLRTERAGAARYVAEEWLHGDELSVEALVHEGRVVFLNTTETQLYPGAHPVERGHVVPAAAEGVPAAEKAMHTLVAATGFRSGILHAEWILRDGTPHLLECAARLPGDYIPLLIALAYDSDLVRGLLDVLEGRPPTMAATPVRGAAVRFLDAVPGTVREIRGLDAARALPGVVDIWMSVEPGGSVVPLTSSWSRAGEAVALGSDRAEAAANALAAASAVEIVTTASA